MKEIPLSRGMTALISDEDYDRVAQFKWCVMKVQGTTAYAGRYFKGTYMALHRFIMSPPDDMQIDHINRNGLDNRRENLRICTASQNQANRACKSKASGYHGVTPDRGKWKAHIEFKGQHFNLGRYVTAEGAARARDAKAAELFGEFATLNFPNETPDMSAIVTVDRMTALRTRKRCRWCGATYAVAGLGQHQRACEKRAKASRLRVC
jgi:hypothetical protein